jgi:hypothetical protein
MGQRSVPFHVFAQTHALLELNLVLLRRRSPCAFSDAGISGQRLSDRASWVIRFRKSFDRLEHPVTPRIKLDADLEPRQREFTGNRPGVICGIGERRIRMAAVADNQCLAQERVQGHARLGEQIRWR